MSTHTQNIKRFPDAPAHALPTSQKSRRGQNSISNTDLTIEKNHDKYHHMLVGMDCVQGVENRTPKMWPGIAGDAPNFPTNKNLIFGYCLQQD